MYVLENEIVHDSAKAYHILWMCISKFVTNTLFLRENFRKTLNAALLGRKKSLSLIIAFIFQLKNHFSVDIYRKEKTMNFGS